MENLPDSGITPCDQPPLQFLHLMQRLKHTPRTGWLRFIEHPESMASHSFGVALLGIFAPDGLDHNKCLFMGLVHDIGEAVVGDIPTYAGVSKEDKHRREAAAFEWIYELLAHDGYSVVAQKILSAWFEYEEGKTEEAKWMKQMDKFECLVQASEYERETHGKKNLEEFQGLSSKIHSPVLKGWLDMLQEERKMQSSRRNQPCPLIFVTGSLGEDDTRYADLAMEFKLQHISLVAVLRKASLDNTYRHAGLVKRFLEKRVDLPVSLVVDLLDTSILEGNSARSWCLVSGFPQSEEQLHEFEKVQNDNYVLLVNGPVPPMNRNDIWIPQKKEFTEGHFAESD